MRKYGKKTFGMHLYFMTPLDYNMVYSYFTLHVCILGLCFDFRVEKSFSADGNTRPFIKTKFYRRK